jgi:hypothetical protein
MAKMFTEGERERKNEKKIIYPMQIFSLLIMV